LYEPIKTYIGAEDGKQWKKFAAGGLSGMIGSAIANPADLIKTRMQASPPGESYTVGWHINDVYSKSGIGGFWAGVAPTVIRATLLNGTKLGTYDAAKHSLIDNEIMADGKKC